MLLTGECVVEQRVRALQVCADEGQGRVAVDKEISYLGRGSGLVGGTVGMVGHQLQVTLGGILRGGGVEREIPLRDKHSVGLADIPLGELVVASVAVIVIVEDEGVLYTLGVGCRKQSGVCDVAVGLCGAGRRGAFIGRGAFLVVGACGTISTAAARER